MKLKCLLSLLLGSMGAAGEPFDAAPFALPLADEVGLVWEDPREIHNVVVRFAGPAPAPDAVRLEYWGSRWPEQRLPKDRQPGGGDVGWMELGNWYKYGWRVADTEARKEGSAIVFTFPPVNRSEFPSLGDYPAAFRYTLKIRIVSEERLPAVERFEAFTDSGVKARTVSLVWRAAPDPDLQVSAFNGIVRSHETTNLQTIIELDCAENSDPNTFDRTLVTIANRKDNFTFAVDDLSSEPLFMPQFGVAVLAGGHESDYSKATAQQRDQRGQSLYDRVAARPEQTWQGAWTNMPAKKSRIYFPMGLDGGRQRFRLDADGTVRFRYNDRYLKARPGTDTPRLETEAGPVEMRLGSSAQPVHREIEDGSLPVCTTVWEQDGVTITQTAFVTELGGTKAEGPVPAADALAVFLARFDLTNTADSARQLVLPLRYRSGNRIRPLELSADGLLRVGECVRGQLLGVSTSGQKVQEQELLLPPLMLAPREYKTLLLKIPYLQLTDPSELTALARLDFETERNAVAGYWRRRLDESARLITPEPVLDEFYRAHAGHLLINCEREPGSTPPAGSAPPSQPVQAINRRFARVGSFSYGAYGNESCMMVVDLERRGYPREAQECLDAWLHYQGSVGLPGDFSSREGVLYGAGGYEAGGYNQHHGWILWMLAEHYRFTRDKAWLQRSAPGILGGADWVIRETRRTAERHPLERGLLPAGSLEDIGDWWTWLSTSCYTWRGLDSAAWALEQIDHPEAGRVRREAQAYHANLLRNFRTAAERSPVVRLRDGTAVTKFPSHVHRRGRSFGWICETLEGAIHLLVTGALPPDVPEAEWILKDYEDNLYLSNQYGYTLDDFDRWWFDRGGMSMQACLLLGVEPYLFRDDVKHALRAMFNAIAVSHFPDVHLNTEHALPDLGDWRGDHYKSSDEANAAGWLRYLFVREAGNELLIGQAVPREWLAAGCRCGVQRTSTHFGPASIVYEAGPDEITARLDAPTRNPPRQIRLRFRLPDERPLTHVTVNAKRWRRIEEDWVMLPGDIGTALVKVRLR